MTRAVVMPRPRSRTLHNYTSISIVISAAWLSQSVFLRPGILSAEYLMASFSVSVKPDRFRTPRIPVLQIPFFAIKPLSTCCIASARARNGRDASLTEDLLGAFPSSLPLTRPAIHGRGIPVATIHLLTPVLA